MDILELGCGFKKYEGRPGIDNVVHIDRNYRCKPDILFEMKHRAKLPFKDSCFDETRMHHMLEHVDDIVWCMEEVYRIGKPDSSVKIWVPHASNIKSFTDPTHKHHMTLESMDYFNSTRTMYTLGYTDIDLRVMKSEPIFADRKFGKLGRLLFRILGQERYEVRLSSILRINEIYFELKVIKK